MKTKVKQNTVIVLKLSYLLYIGSEVGILSTYPHSHRVVWKPWGFQWNRSNIDEGRTYETANWYQSSICKLRKFEIPLHLYKCGIYWNLVSLICNNMIWLFKMYSSIAMFGWMLGLILSWVPWMRDPQKDPGFLQQSPLVSLRPLRKTRWTLVWRVHPTTCLLCPQGV